MTDKELLAAAARAAGLPAFAYGATGLRVASDGCKSGYIWSPLTDDGDALRLAVKLRFCTKDFAPVETPDVVQALPDGALFGMVEIWRQDDDDPIYVEWYKAGADRYVATRRAIVCAAAELGSSHNAVVSGAVGIQSTES
jgi:hypothetical protein